MPAKRLHIADLLGRAEDLSPLIDPHVRAVAESMTKKPDEITLAGSCLGSSVEAIDKLLRVRILPDKLPPEKQKELSNFLGVSPDNLAKAIAANRDYTAQFLGLPVPSADPPKPIPSSTYPAYPLFLHQRKAAQTVHRRLISGRDRMVLHMPTGSGKTRTTMNIVCDILRNREPALILWLASTKELLAQASLEFANAWYNIGNREVPIHTAWGGEDLNLASLEDGFLGASPQTLNTRLKSEGAEQIGELASKVALIIFDEAHQALAPTYRDLIERISSGAQPVAPVIGLTATPGRTFGGTLEDEELSAFFGHTKIRLNTESSSKGKNPIEYLVGNEYLAATEFKLLGELPSEMSENANYQIEDTENIGIEVEEYLFKVTQAVKELIDEGHTRILVFAASVYLSDVVASCLRALEINASSVKGETESAVRDTLIRQYKSRTNDVRILVSFNVLTTGFDAPQTSGVVIARPTKSLVLYSQMVGRGIRGRRAGGNRNAKVITVVDPTVEAFGSIAKAFEHWEEHWEGENE